MAVVEAVRVGIGQCETTVAVDTYKGINWELNK
jgi:hypothetical protein